MPGELARRIAGRADSAPSRVVLHGSSTAIVTSDRHELTCTFECAAHVADNSTDQRTAQQVLLSDRDIATATELIDRLRGTIVSAASEFAANQTVGEILTDQGRQSMLDALTHGANAAAFACGVELIGPYRLDLHSGSFTRQQLEAVEQGAARRACGPAACQFQTCRRAAEGIRHDPRRDSGGVRQLDSREPSRRIAARRSSRCCTHPLAAHSKRRPSGPSLAPIWFASTRTEPPTIETAAVIQTLGPLRSLRPAECNSTAALLIGDRIRRLCR